MRWYFLTALQLVHRSHRAVLWFRLTCVGSDPTRLLLSSRDRKTPCHRISRSNSHCSQQFPKAVSFTWYRRALPRIQLFGVSAHARSVVGNIYRRIFTMLIRTLHGLSSASAVLRSVPRLSIAIKGLKRCLPIAIFTLSSRVSPMLALVIYSAPGTSTLYMAANRHWDIPSIR